MPLNQSSLAAWSLAQKAHAHDKEPDALCLLLRREYLSGDELVEVLLCDERNARDPRVIGVGRGDLREFNANSLEE